MGVRKKTPVEIRKMLYETEKEPNEIQKALENMEVVIQDLQKELKMDNRAVIGEVLKKFTLNYTNFTLDSEGVKAGYWEAMLSEFPPKIILAACAHIMATRTSDYGWAPDIATMREQCANMAAGELHPPSGADAWEHIMEAITASARNEEIKLSQMERAALKKVSTLFDLSQSRNIGAERVQFIKVFDEMIAKQRFARATLPEIRQLVAKNAVALLAGATGDKK